MHTEIEVWRDAVGYEGLYQISSWGRVKSVARLKNWGNGGVKFCEERIMYHSYDYKGYPVIILRKDLKRKSVKIHRLVATAFIPNPEGKLQVNHKDGNKSNNNLTNLEWVSNSENQRHAVQIGLKKSRRAA